MIDLMQAFAGTLVVNIVGWTYTLVKSARQAGERDGGAKSMMKENRIYINHLPCIADPQFVGSLKEHIKGIDEKLADNEKHHEHITKSLEEIKRAIDNHNGGH